MRLIDADDLMEKVKELSFECRKMVGYWGRYYEDALQAVQKMISNAADVEPVRHGEWIKTSEFMPIYGCSMCGERNLFRDGNNVLSPYCPHCGAKMDTKA